MPDFETELSAIMKAHVGRTGGLISALRAAQGSIGFLPEAAERIAAEAFNLSRAEVKGVISFYADFRRAPAGRTVVRLCAAEACQAAGARALSAALEEKFALKSGETSPSGELTFEPVYCLGLCSAAPAAIVDGELVGRADTGRIEAAIARSKKAENS
jgi:formate dehydrogenase subunit gamma